MDVNKDVLTNLHKELLQGMYFDYDDTSTKFIDIITIMGSLFVYEPEIRKGNKGQTISIPVFNYFIWEKEQTAVEELFGWVTDMPVSIQFTNMTPPNIEEGLILSLPALQDVALFYDDIESIAGVNDHHKNNSQITYDYIRLINKDNEKAKQQKLAAFLRKTISDSSEILVANIKLLNKRKIKTTPSAILLVLTIAAAKSYFNGGVRVFYYHSKRIDTNMINLAKASHPKTYQLLNALYQRISLEMKIETPILHKTRATIIKEMPKEYKLQIKHTNECLRMKRKTVLPAAVTTPCGICTACLQRKIALAAADSEVYDGFYQYDYGQKVEEITSEQDQQIYKDTLELIKSLYKELNNKKQFDEEYQHLGDDFLSAFDYFFNRYNPY